MKFVTVTALIPLSAALLLGQNEGTRATTTWNGTLVDAACESSHSVERESTRSTSPDGLTTTQTSRTVTKTQNATCPVTSSTTSFGLMTPEGRYIRFDEAGNTRILESIRRNSAWNRGSAIVTGTPNGDVVTIQSFEPVGNQTTVTTETILDARYKGDNGKLILGPDTVTWQNLEHTDRSHTWTYSEIKELKREKNDNEIKIEAYHGDEHEFKIRGAFLTDQAYNMIAERIIAARRR